MFSSIFDPFKCRGPIYIHPLVAVYMEKQAAKRKAKEEAAKKAKTTNNAL